MADLGQCVARLMRLAYPSVDGSTREVIGVYAFLDDSAVRSMEEDPLKEIKKLKGELEKALGDIQIRE